MKKYKRAVLYHPDYGLFMGTHSMGILVSDGLSDTLGVFKPFAFNNEISARAWANGRIGETASNWKTLELESSGADYFMPDDFAGTELEKFALPLIMIQRNLDGATLH
jgi:hypothetical protein